MAVIGVTGEGARAQHQAMLVGDHHRALDAEFVGLACLALADALNLGRMQGVKLVLVALLLGADGLEQQLQPFFTEVTAKAANSREARIKSSFNVALA